MKRYAILSALTVFAACGGGEPAADSSTPATEAAPAATASAPAGPGGAMTTPDWYQVDADAQTVHLTITAGATPDANYWNFNGATQGSMAITVPEGYTVTVELVNDDPNMAHSLGISDVTSSFGAMMDPTPVFAGAMTENPTSMVDGTMPGESESITFVADAAGNYSMVCYIPGHAATGMWIYFNVSSDGSMGVQGS